MYYAPLLLWTMQNSVGSGAKRWLWKGFRRTDAVTWTRVAVTPDGSADGYPSGCIWNARGQLLPAAPSCYQPRAWDTYARVRCVASQVRLQSDRLDTVNRSGTPGLAFGVSLAHLRRAEMIAVSCTRRRSCCGQCRTASAQGRNVGFGRGFGGPTP